MVSRLCRAAWLTLIVAASAACLAAAQADKPPIRVGVYVAPAVPERRQAASTAYARRRMSALWMDTGIRARLIEPEDLADGVLKELDVVVFPGGSARRQASGLGYVGAVMLKRFIERGGGYVGICAGAYLGAHPGSKPRYEHERLGLVNVKLRRTKKGHWDRGGAIVKARVTDAGKKLLPELGGKDFVHMHYHSGPLLEPAKAPDMAPAEVLMRFVTDVSHKKPENAGEMADTILLVRARYGKGMAVLCSAHPEVTPGFRWMLARMVRWAAQREGGRFPDRFVKPFRYTREILFDKEWKKAEKDYLTKLTGKTEADEAAKLDAIARLKAMASRTVQRVLPKPLADPSPKVRKAAVETIAYYEVFLALPSLRKALGVENDPEVRQALQQAAAHLRTGRRPGAQ